MNTHATFHEVTAEDLRNAETFNNGSRTDGTFRILGDGQARMMKLTNVTDPFDLVKPYYLKRVAEFRAGTHRPVRLRNFASVITNFDRWLTDRIPENEKACVKNENGNPCWVTIIPFTYRIPHPTDAEVDLWMEKWNDDGELNQTCHTLVQNKDWVFLPTVVYNRSQPNSMVMMTVMMMRANVPGATTSRARSHTRGRPTTTERDSE